MKRQTELAIGLGVFALAVGTGIALTRSKSALSLDGLGRAAHRGLSFGSKIGGMNLEAFAENFMRGVEQMGNGENTT